MQVYDPNVSIAHAMDAEASGRGNDVVPDLRARMVPSIGALIDGAGVLLMGNSYDEATGPLATAMTDHAMVDLARLRAGVVSHRTYQGICW